MPLDTVDALVEALRGRPILRPDQLDEVVRQYAPAAPDTQGLARALIRLRWLTVYQAKKLLAGKADELVIGPYVVLDKLGEGGMGKVYKAVQLSLGRVVALKVVRGSLLKNETALKRFRREVKAAADLNHPNIVRVFDADEVGDRHFLAMEYIEGVDLAKLVRDRGPLPVEMACSYVRQAALGLQHAHDRKTVHRDIKPSNLLVAADAKGQYTPRNVVRILDMGLARVRSDEPTGDHISTELTQTGTVVGTPDFMSPEQAKNSSTVDHRSDLYALGCTLYYLLTGEPPFPTGTPLEKLLQHQTDPPRPIQQLRPEVPPEVATILHTLLAKKPGDRFQSGSALAHALEPWGSGAGQSGMLPTMVLPAEAVDPDSVLLETDPNDPFDFGAGQDARTPVTPRRTPPPVPPPKPRPRPEAPRKPFPRPAVIAAAVVLGLLAVGSVGAAFLIGGKKKPTDPVPATQEPPKADPVKPAPRAKADPPPAKELEAVEKYLPDDAGFVAVFDAKQLQSVPAVKKSVLARLADDVAPFRQLVGVDLLAVVERVIVAGGPDDQTGTVIILQGRSLVTPRLTEGLRAAARRGPEPAGEGGPDLFALGSPPTFAAAHETSLILSDRRELVADALEKRDGAKRTQLADPTVAAGLASLARVQELAFARPPAAELVLGLRQGWEKLLPAAGKLNSMAAVLTFDDRGMHLHTLAEEQEPGKALELQKALGRLLKDRAGTVSPPDQRLERVGHLLADATAVRLPNKARYTHLRASVPAGRLDDWFAPFVPARGDR